MNLDLDEDQRLLQEACASLFQKQAGPDRARALNLTGDCDRPLLKALDEAGMLDLSLDPGIGPLGAELLTEWAAEAAAVAPVGWRLLVAPRVMSGDIPPVVCVTRGRFRALCRHAHDADVILAVDDGEAYLARPGEWTATPVPSRYGYALAEVEIEGGTALGPEAADAITRWSQVVVASEIAGAARAAHALTVEYVKSRKQFGRVLGGYQAIQHRLAEDLASIEAASLLAREAAFNNASAETAAVAATFAADCAHRVITDLHQFTGALGFAKEYNLHIWTMRLEYLLLEAGGLEAHAEALFTSRWSR